MKKHLICIWLMIAILCPLTSSGYIQDNTHPLINEYAIYESNVDSYLVEQLGFSNGYNEVVNTLSVLKWVKQGGNYEDNFPRSINHFHDPKKAWDKAGILGLGYSSLQWAQDHTIGPAPPCDDLSALGISCPESLPSANPEWSWPAARTYFYQAVTSQVLTSLDATVRDQKFGKTFLTLGHVMHLLADAAVPEHTRDDQHLFVPWHFGSRYEKQEEDQAKNGNLSRVINQNYMLYPVDYSEITSISNVPGYIPISNFWDTTPNPGYGGTLLGLAEYTNYNFLSPGTIFKTYTYPVNPQNANQTLTGEKVIAEDGKVDYRLYFSGVTSDNRPIKHLVSTGYLSADLKDVSVPGMDSSKFVLDEKCYDDYASILVPMAVSYDAALIDYFFRGDIEITLPGRGVYGFINNTANPADPNFREIRLKVRNSTVTAEEMSNGTVQLVVKYKVAELDTFQSGTVPSSGLAHIYDYDDPGRGNDFYYTVVNASNPVTSIPKGDPVELVFDLSDNPIPLLATDVYLQIVYRGQLGNESDAVVVGFKDISEPTPIGIVNDMDYVCINGAWYVAGSQLAFDNADLNGDNMPDGDIYPHNVTDIYFKFSSKSNPVTASTSAYTVQLAGLTLPPGSAISQAVYVLTDEQFTLSSKWRGTKTTTPQIDQFIEGGNTPQAYLVDSVPRQDDWEPPIYQEHRGKTIWFVFAATNRAIPFTAECSLDALDAIAPTLQSFP